MDTLTCFSYTCSSVSEDTQKLLKYSNKILLPASMLHKVMSVMILNILVFQNY